MSMPSRFFVDRVDRVADDRGVAVAARVVEVDEQLLVVHELLLVELGALEEVDRLLVRLLEGAAQSLVLELRIALEVDPADLHLVLAVDQKGYRHGLARAQRVVVDAYIHLGVAETLVGPVFLDEALVLVEHVVRELAAPLEFELFEQVFLLALRDALEFPVVDPRPLLEEYLQVEAVALDVGTDLDVGEETLAPETRDSVRDEVARQIDRVAGDETGRRFEHLVVEVLHSVDVHIADVIELGGSVGFEHRGVFGESRGFDGSRVLRLSGLLRRLGEYIRAAQHEGRGCEE